MGSIHTTLAVLVMGVVSPAAPRISARVARRDPPDGRCGDRPVLDHGRLPLDDLGNIVNDCDASTLQPRWAAALDAVVNEWRALPAAVLGLELVAVYAARRVASPRRRLRHRHARVRADARRRCRRAVAASAWRVAAAVVRARGSDPRAHPCVAAVEMAITVASASTPGASAVARGEPGAPHRRARGRLDAFPRTWLCVAGADFAAFAALRAASEAALALPADVKRPRRWARCSLSVPSCRLRRRRRRCTSRGCASGARSGMERAASGGGHDGFSDLLAAIARSAATFAGGGGGEAAA